jgi:hypothetical protein
MSILTLRQNVAAGAITDDGSVAALGMLRRSQSFPPCEKPSSNAVRKSPAGR